MASFRRTKEKTLKQISVYIKAATWGNSTTLYTITKIIYTWTKGLNGKQSTYLKKTILRSFK